MRLRREFEAKIELEMKQKHVIDKRINVVQRKSININDKINTLSEFSAKNSIIYRKERNMSQITHNTSSSSKSNNNKLLNLKELLI